MMYHLSVEHHKLATNNQASLIENLAHHLYTHQIYGRAAIITENSSGFLSSLKTEWYSLEQELKYRRSHTKDPRHTSELTNELIYMRHCSFTTKPPIEEPYEQVQIATIEQFLEWPPQSQTMYITCPIKIEELHKVTAWMPRYGLVVIYDDIHRPSTHTQMAVGQKAHAKVRV